MTEFIPVYISGILCFCFIQPVNVRQKQFAGRTQGNSVLPSPSSEITGHFVQRKTDCKTCIKLQAGSSHPANFYKHSSNSERYKNSELYLLIRLILAFNPLVPLYNWCPLVNLLIKIEFLWKHTKTGFYHFRKFQASRCCCCHREALFCQVTGHWKDTHQ